MGMKNHLDTQNLVSKNSKTLYTKLGIILHFFKKLRGGSGNDLGMRKPQKHLNRGIFNMKPSK